MPAMRRARNARASAHGRTGNLIARELIGAALVPGGKELRLFRHDSDFMIVLDRDELMSTRMSGSESALATMTCARLAGRSRPRLLIGGYGMGFTLRAALAVLGEEAQVVVAELVPQVVIWARGAMRDLTAGCLEDPRVELVLGDVADAIASGSESYDAILLDVDNGPDGLTRAANDRLYSAEGLKAAMAALKPGGVLAVWSAARDNVFAARLRKAGFRVEEAPVRARSNGKGPTHVIWLAEAP